MRIAFENTHMIDLSTVKEPKLCVCVCVCVSNCKIKSTLLRHLFIFHLFNVVNQDIILISHMRKLRSFEVKQLTWEVTLNIKMRILDQVICIQVPGI